MTPTKMANSEEHARREMAESDASALPRRSAKVGRRAGALLRGLVTRRLGLICQLDFGGDFRDEIGRLGKHFGGDRTVVGTHRQILRQETVSVGRSHQPRLIGFCTWIRN